jgi:hypothetical protein
MPRGDKMLRFITCFPTVALCAGVIAADDRKTAVRPISEAETVIAVYREDWGLFSRGNAIILVAWLDGKVVWSEDRLKGGAPYRTGHIDPKRVTALLARFEKEGLFANEKLNRGHTGADSQHITVFIKSGKRQVKMESWHELFEESGKYVGYHEGMQPLEGRRRLDVLSKQPADYLFFRFIWSETRGRLTELIPSESKPSAGKPFLEGVMTWQEPGVAPKPKGNSDPSKK